MTWSPDISMRLKPELPPGRANRKALLFTTDICRLRGAGYTFSAIRNALLEAGINVSLTTVKREAARGVASGQTLPTHTFASSQTPSPATTGAGLGLKPSPPTAALPATPLPGKAVAEAFMQSIPTNSLFLKETTE